MARKKKNGPLKLHPITSFIILIVATIILSAILSLFNISASYDSVNITNNELSQSIATINSMLNSKGIKFIISNASKNFASLTTLSTVIITLMGIGVAEETGLLQTVMKRRLGKINPKLITFLLILTAVFSSIFSDLSFA